MRVRMLLLCGWLLFALVVVGQLVGCKSEEKKIDPEAQKRDIEQVKKNWGQ